MALCQMEGAEPSPGIITTSGPEPCTVTEMRRDEKTDAASASPGIRLVIVSASAPARSEEHTSELQSLMRISSAVFCLKKKKNQRIPPQYQIISYAHNSCIT